MGNSNKNCVTSEYSDKKEEYFEKVKKGYFTLIKKDVKKRFEASEWNVIEVKDGNNVNEINKSPVNPNTL